MTHRTFTIGHSTRTLSELVALLRGAGANFVADVRKIPRSRTNPQFNADTLPAALATEGIGYRHLPKLGGLRKQDGASPNEFWKNASFRNYADYAMTAPFHEGLDELRTLAPAHTPALMCAETLWWRCHRRIIADYLIAAGDDVRHIIGPGHIEPARLTPAAHPCSDGNLTYSALAM